MIPSETQKTKYCHKCGKLKPVRDFYKCKGRKDGLQTCCKVCKLEQNKKWYEDNSEHHNEWMREHSRRNRAMYNARDAKRRASELQATPPWADQDRIKRIYALRQKVTERTGIVHHVDHIIPLQGETVCGLHVEKNLAVIPSKLNLSKGNKY